MGKIGIKKLLKHAVRPLAVVVCMVAAVVLLTGEGALQLGQSLALLSVGMMSPEGGVQVLNERLERIPAANGGEVRLPYTTSPYQPGTGNQPDPQHPAVDNLYEYEYSGEYDRTVPPEAGDGGRVVEEQISPGSEFVQNIGMKNNSSHTIDINAELEMKPELGLKDTDEPQVLIMHTHTTEAYMTYYAGYYNASDPSRSFDNNINVMAAGDMLAAQLRAAGIGVIHDVTVFDNPKYTGAYDRSAQRIKEILAQNPSIKVVIDLHRDAISRAENVRCKPTTVVNGLKAAQLMIISSVHSSAAVPHPDWQHNLGLALRLQQEINTEYPGLVRPLNLVDSRYNQHLTRGSLLIEVGSEANTPDEAIYSAKLLGESLAKVLHSLK